ncbi:MAG: methyl-accepting chemotaxis protein [Defluviitaleaceae bacterium]|nr:methyl-accepting chemotaxis protein [Defluviitaleaceae bacterium]
MSALRNMKIGARLTFAFVVLLLITIMVATFGAIAVMRTDNDYSNTFDHPNARYITLNEIRTELMDIRRIVALASLNAGDQTAINVFEGELNVARNTIVGEISAFRRNILDDPIQDASALNFQYAQINILEAMILSYIDNTAPAVFVAARAGNQSQAIGLINHAMENEFAAIYDQFDLIFYELSIFMEGINEIITADTINTVIILVALTAISLFSGVVMAVVITGLITKPMSQAVDAIKNVSRGNLNINFNRKNISKDEVGVLTDSIIGLSDTIKNIVDDLTNMHEQYIQVGNIHFNIDDAKYQGSYKEMIGLVNSLLAQVTTDILDIADTCGSIADGNFEHNINEAVWVGDWVVMPKALKNLTVNLKGVSAEVTAMIDATASKGDLNFRTDAGSYKGDWQKIMLGLNDVTEAVDNPLKTMLYAMDEMKAGNFDLQKVDANIHAKGANPNASDYNGTFKNIISAMDATILEVSSYITEITNDLSEISNGNLTTKITREFVGSFAPIKDSLNHISATLHQTMSEILVASEQVLSGANQIAQSATNLATGAQEQASSVQELVATMDIINLQTKQNADNALEANALSNTSAENAHEGSEAMKNMLGAMSQIKESSKSISAIIRVIQDIAFQTNLLSLNASVEAARAGEHGRGFSVVADEVRSLALRSQQSSTQTTELIHDSISRVESGSNIAETTSGSLDVIVQNASEVLEIINGISIASQEQAEAIGQVSNGLEQISRVTQSNSAVSEEAAASAEELNSQAEMLRQLVSFFKL